MNFLLSGGVTPFAISLLVLAGLVLIEIVLLLVGTHFSGLLDDMLPDMHLDIDSDAGHEFVFAKALHFVGFGRVPFMMVLMSFLASFGLSGFLVQWASVSLLGTVLAYSGAVPLAFAGGVLLTSRICSVLAKVMPEDQTTVISEKSFVGRPALVTYGTATATLPATAEVVDEHGRKHFVQVKTDREHDAVPEGESLLIVAKVEGFFVGQPVR